MPNDDNDYKFIWLCPLFFTGDDTRNDLPNTENADELNAWCNRQDYTFFTTAGMSLTPRELPLFLLAGDIMTKDPLSSTRSRILMLWRSCFYASELSDFTLPPPNSLPPILLFFALSSSGPLSFLSSHITNLFPFP